MPSLARALAVRLFATKRLAVASTLRLAGLLLLVYTLPGVLLEAGWCVYVYVYYSIISSIFYFFTLIVPLLALVADLVVLPALLLFFVRGYWRLSKYYLAWLRQTYALAQDDIRLNTLFASPEEYLP